VIGPSDETWMQGTGLKVGVGVGVVGPDKSRPLRLSLSDQSS
jgi:hypothetical protein